MEISNLVIQDYWNTVYPEVQLKKPDSRNSLAVWIRRSIKKARPGQSCLEIGAFPGRFLSVFGDLGYELNGIDLKPGIEDRVPEWLRQEGYSIGEFYREDFFSHTFGRKFDIVFSAGFIEHFVNYLEVIERHAALVKENGSIFLEVPNFRGIVQKVLKLMLDKKNLSLHYTPSMNPVRWKRCLEKMGFGDISYEYIGGYKFVHYPQKRNYLQRKTLKALKKNAQWLRDTLLKGDSKHYSQMIVMTAGKNKF
jgi:2-polyprenyl-3-methyl-5-hydroxy-6-metoxy-1,4-benzoquinol methylase